MKKRLLIISLLTLQFGCSTSLTEKVNETNEVKSYAKFVPEREDDFAWENDLVAFRMYGPASKSTGPALWDSQAMAATAIEKFKQQTDIYFPGFEEEELLFYMTSVEVAAEQLKGSAINEVVMKNGPQSCCLIDNNTIKEGKIIPAKTVVDTTGAGDTFNGGYIGARCLGVAPVEAILFAASAAAYILTVCGGVLPQNQLAELKTSIKRNI